MLVSSFRCGYETADIEFGFTFSQAIDRGNSLAYHLIQSFESGEVDYEEALTSESSLPTQYQRGNINTSLLPHRQRIYHNHIFFRGQLCSLSQVQFQQVQLLRDMKDQRQAVLGKQIILLMSEVSA